MRKKAAGRKRAGGSKGRGRTRSKGRSAITRVKKGLGRDAKGHFVKHPRHRVRAHKRRVPGTRRKVRVRSHLSHEAKEAAAKKRRRRQRAAPAKESTMAGKRRRKASGRKRARREHAASAAEPKKRRTKRRKTSAAPRKRGSTRRRTHRVAEAATRKRRRGTRRRSARRRNPIRSFSGAGYCRQRKKHPRAHRGDRVLRNVSRTGYSRKRKAAKRRARKKSYPQGGWSPSSDYPYGMENPLANPLSGMGILATVGLGALGYLAADLTDRYLANMELGTGGSQLATGATPLSPAMAALSKPGTIRILVQAGLLVAAPLGVAQIGKMAAYPKIKTTLQGIGLGAGVHLLSQLVQHYVLVPWLGGQTAPATGATPTMLQNINGLYSAEIVADNLAIKASTGTAGNYTAIGAPNGANGVISGIAAYARPGGAMDPLRGFRTPTAQLAAAPAGRLAGCGCQSTSTSSSSGQPGCDDGGETWAPPAGMPQSSATVAAGSGNGGTMSDSNDGTNPSPIMPTPVISPLPGGASGGGNGASGSGASGGGNGTVSPPVSSGGNQVPTALHGMTMNAYLAGVPGPTFDAPVGHA